MNIFVALAFLLILGALGAAGFFMLRRGEPGDTAKSKRMARALALRVALSISVFALIWLAYALGWIQPTGIQLKR